MMWKTVVPSLTLTVGLWGIAGWAFEGESAGFDREIEHTFAKQQIRLSAGQIGQIRESVKVAVDVACKNPQGNSKVGFSAVEIATDLGLRPQTDQSVVDRIRQALTELASNARCSGAPDMTQYPSWEDYFNKTVSLTHDPKFLSLVGEKQFHPVKISWEDIGRYENSVWGDRISDVGIWVRKREDDPASAELALSVRRDSNYRDKVLMVPAERIKVHTQVAGKTVEQSLPERLRQLGLTSRTKDRYAIVSNQFAIVPVPSRRMGGASKAGEPPRAAFNFSIYPYGSTNFVITDVIEGSSNAVVGPGTHQLLYANINGKKAPFTASRAEDRQDLMKLESELKAKGMDVDVQRYYLIQVPLQKEARDIRLSNMGSPPMQRSYVGSVYLDSADYAAEAAPMPSQANKAMALKRENEGLGKVAIGHGEAEGRYFGGSGYRNKRAEEPVRVTVVYFVTPKGEISRQDMENFSKTFETWDSQAIWGGSFVVKDDISSN